MTHSSPDFGRFTPLKRRILARFIKQVDQFVFVGDHLPDQFREAGFSIDAQRTVIEDAFIPPPLEDADRIWASYEPEVSQFVHGHSPLVVANAHRIVFQDGIDLYGMDMCVDLIAELKNDYPNIGMIFALAEIADQPYFDQIKRRVNEAGVRENYLFLTGQREMWPLFEKANLMVRPTSADGYGISVAEALHFGCPAVASDVCTRAEGTVLFRSRSLDDFQDKCRGVLRGQ